MSDNIPIDIHVEIISMLPVKSLIHFRSVSKTWKSLIHDSDFILNYTEQHRHMQHLLITYAKRVGPEEKYVSVIDNNTFPQQQVPLAPPLLLKRSIIIGSSQGLLCLYGDYQKGRDHGPFSGTAKAVIWNPSVRKEVAVVVPDVADVYGMYHTVLGFGVCRETSDPKIVKITYITNYTKSYQVEVFTLITRAWRSLCSSNLARKSIKFRCFKEVIDGVVYWLAYYTDTVDDKIWTTYNLIISFDITSEEFTEISLGDKLSCTYVSNLSISQLRESLVLLERANNLDYDIWMMEDGDSKSFTKLFTFDFNIPDSIVIGFRGFTKTGEPLFEIGEDYHRALGVYEPYLKHIKSLGIGKKNLFHFLCIPTLKLYFCLISRILKFITDQKFVSTSHKSE